MYQLVSEDHVKAAWEPNQSLKSDSAVSKKKETESERLNRLVKEAKSIVSRINNFQPNLPSLLVSQKDIGYVVKYSDSNGIIHELELDTSAHGTVNGSCSQCFDADYVDGVWETTGAFSGFSQDEVISSFADHA